MARPSRQLRLVLGLVQMAGASVGVTFLMREGPTATVLGITVATSVVTAISIRRRTGDA